MKTVEEARAQILSMVSVLPTETVSIYEAHGRVLAEPVVSDQDMPPFDSSGMDGFAVRAADTLQASPNNPAVLKVVDEVSAGEVPRVKLEAGQAIRIMTGAPIPLGADAVIRIEATNAHHAHSNKGHIHMSVACFEPVQPGEAVRGAGREFLAGQEVLKKHTVLGAPALALAAMAGKSHLTVFKRPIVGIASTGNEVVAPGDLLQPGQIRDANLPMLVAMAHAAGAQVKTYRIVPDSLDATKTFFAQAARECDVVLTTGGVSMGEFDYIRPALEDLGELHMWRVACKPGKPQTLGRIDRSTLAQCPSSHMPGADNDALDDVQGISQLSPDERCVNAPAKAPSQVERLAPANNAAPLTAPPSHPYCLVFGLPGNPSSAYVGFELFVRPMLRAMQGFHALDRPTVYAQLNQDVHKTEDRRYYLRGKLEICSAPQGLSPQATQPRRYGNSGGQNNSEEKLALSTGHRIPAESFVVDVSARQTSQLISAAHHGDVLVVLADGARIYHRGDWVSCIRLDLPEEAS